MNFILKVSKLKKRKYRRPQILQVDGPADSSDEEDAVDDDDDGDDDDDDDDDDDIDPDGDDDEGVEEELEGTQDISCVHVHQQSNSKS